jgi:Uma2 family endonuclease
MATLQGHWTYADWETLPDDGNRYEVIDGVLYMTTAPSFFHQWIIGRLHRYLGIAAEDQGLAFAVAAPIGLLMPGCSPVQPDYMVVLASRAGIIHDRRIWAAPDLIVEVLSPSNVELDEDVKLNSYAQAGVPEYAIVDPLTRTLRHYRLEAPDRYGAPATAGADDTVAFDCLPTLQVPVGDLFAGSPDTTL